MAKFPPLPAMMRARTIAAKVATETGDIHGLGGMFLKKPVSYAKTGGNANLSVAAATGAIAAAIALGEGEEQTISGTATGADGLVIPWSATLTGTVPITLADLGLATATVAEDAAPGTVISAISGKTAGSALSLADDAGGRFAIDGSNQLVAGLTGFDYEAAASHDITIRETLAGASNSPHDTVLAVAVTNIFEQPDLGDLGLSATTFVEGAAASGTITGATAGSTIEASGLPTGLTIDGAARTWAWDGTGFAEAGTLTLTETLADSANSPRDSDIGFEIVEPARMDLGMGIGGLAYASGVLPFANILWHGPGNWQRYGAGSDVFSEDRGLLTVTPDSIDQFQKIAASGASAVALPLGTYTVLNPGGHKIAIRQLSESPQNTAFTQDTQFTFTRTVASTSALYLLAEGSVSTPVRIILPGHLTSWNAGDLFNADFLSFVDASKAKVLRFMDWTNTNRNTTSEWSQRSLESDLSFNENTVPWTVCIKLCNLLGKHGWFNAPPRASNDYLDNLAALLASDYSPSLNVYAENGNEIWNGGSAFLDNFMWYTTYDFTRYTAAVTTTPDHFNLPAHGFSGGENIVAFSTDGAASYPLSNGGGAYIDVIDSDNFQLRDSYPAGAIRSASVGTNLLFSNRNEAGKTEHRNASHGAQSLNYWNRLDAALGRSRVKHELGMQNTNTTTATEALAAAGVSAATDHLAGATYLRSEIWHAKIDIASEQISPSAWAGSAQSLSSKAVVFGVYALGSTPTPAEVKAGTGTGFIGGQTVNTVANSTTYGTAAAITGLSDGTEYELRVAYTDIYGDVAIASGTFTASATPSTAYFNEPYANVTKRLRQSMNAWMASYQDVIALGKELTQYEYNPDFFMYGSVNGLGINDTNSNAYRAGLFASDEYVQVFKELNYELASLDQKLACVFVDVASNSSFALADSYTDNTDPRFVQFSAFNGQIAKPANPVMIGGIAAADILTAPSYPYTIAVLGDAGYTYAITAGNDGGWYDIVGNELRLLSGNNIDFGTPAARTIKVEALDGTTSSNFDVTFTTGEAWYAGDASFVFDSVADSDNAAINPIIGNALTLGNGTGATIADGLWAMLGTNRYNNSTAYDTAAERTKSTLIAMVLDINGDTNSNRVHARVLGTPQAVDITRGTGNLNVRWNNGSNHNLTFSGTIDPVGEHVFWIYFTEVDGGGDAQMHCGYDQIENTAQGPLTFARASNPGRTVELGGAGSAASSMKFGDFEIINRAGMTLADALTEVQKIMNRWSIM